MRCAHNKNQSGFTLVEISIVMIIIGLLIGGTFGGMKLVENAQVNKTVQDLKSIESAALTFRDTYGRLPGDIVNPASRLPNCTVAPCATSGNGDRRIGLLNSYDDPQSVTNEQYTFWSHLSAADLLSLGTKNTTDMSFGEGQPESPISAGYRIADYNGLVGYCGVFTHRAQVLISSEALGSPATGGHEVSCNQLRNVDIKFDDGHVSNGAFMGAWGCEPTTTCNIDWALNATGIGWYDLRGF